MSKMLLGFVAFSMLALGFLSFANAEEVEEYQYRTFTENATNIPLTAELQIYYENYDIGVEFPVNRHGCETFYEAVGSNENVTRILKQCYWESFDIPRVNPYLDLTFDPDTETMRPTTDVEKEALEQCFNDPECPVGIYEPTKEDEYTKLRDTINPDSESATDQALIDTINRMLGAECYQGVGTTLGSQEVRSFDIPTVTIPIYEEIDGEMVDTGKTQTILDTTTTIKSIDLRNALGDIKKHARECVAQGVLLDIHGGIMSSADAKYAFCDTYAETLTSEESIQAGCGVSSKTYYNELTESTPTWSQARVNEESNFGIERTNIPTKHSAECQRNYGETLRNLLGCPPLEDFVDTIEAKTLADYHDNPVGQAFEQYKEDGGNSMSEELRKKTIADKISELYRQLRATQGGQ